MRFYPELSGARTRTILCDVGALILIGLFAWTGKEVHDTVVKINSLSRGVIDAGTSVRTGFEDAAGRVGGVPVVGGSLADGLRSAGSASGGNVVAAGEAGETAVSDTASVLGWAIFGLPTLVLLAFFVPLRGLQVRRLTLGARALGIAPSVERRRLLAQRAAFGMPWADLRRFTRDPIGDLEAERYEPLVAALYAEAGLRAPGPPGPAPGALTPPH
jgi:hypothetical protein